MRALFVFIAAAFLSVNAQASTQARVVGDELVQNLRCDQVSADSIYKAIRPSAFSIARRITTENFKANSIAHCWALARWQRIALLLGRQNSSVNYDPAAIADLIRGGRPHLNVQNFAIQTPLQNYRVFRWPATQGTVDKQLSQLEKDIRRAKSSTPRNYYEELESAQGSLFYRFSNVYFLLDSQSVRERAETINKIARLAQQNRLPMVNLRYAKDDQHVVLVKSFKRVAKDKWEFITFDANAPRIEKKMLITHSDGHFKINFRYGDRTNNPDIYLVGEDERPYLDSALTHYYQNLCRAKR